MRAIGYFREAKGQSLAEQSESFLEFCGGNGYEAAATFLDVRDGGELAGFKQMLEFVRQQAGQGFLIITVSSLQSLGEAPTEAARRYFQLASLGIPIVSIESGEDISSNLVESWARYRAKGTLGDRVKAAMRRKAVRGEALGRPPYGYKVGPRRRLVVVAQEGSVVRYIFRLYLKNGLGIRRIARRLNEEELRTRRGGLWSMVTVRDILRNRAYVGTYSRFGVRVPASHAPLISQADFQLVQERLDQRRPSTRAREMSPFLLSGLTYCGYCGNKMIGVTRKQKWQRRGDGTVRTAQYRYYQCESRTNRSLCDYHTQRAEKLEARVQESLSSSKVHLGSSRNGGGSPQDLEAQIRRLRDKVRRLDKRLEQYLDSAATGNLNPEKLRTLGVTLASEQLQLEDKLSESHRLAQQQVTEGERRQQRERVLQRLRGEWDAMPLAEKQELLREVLDRIVVRDDGLEMLLRS